MATSHLKPLTQTEKAFWKDAFIACAPSVLSRGVPPDLVAAAACAHFADAALTIYRDRIIWRKAWPLKRYFVTVARTGMYSRLGQARVIAALAIAPRMRCQNIQCSTSAPAPTSAAS